MALENYRIIEHPEKTEVDTSDYMLMDSESNGTNKYQVKRIITEAEAKVAAAVAAEAEAREAADDALQDDIDTRATSAELAAEAAAREQDVADLKADLNQIISPGEKTPISYTQTGYYIALDGATADINNPIASVYGHAYAVVPCSEGDTFIVNAKGGGRPRAWAFINSQYTILDVEAEDVTVSNKRLTAPANAAYLIINDNTTPNATSYRLTGGKNILDQMVRYDIEQSKTDKEKETARNNLGLDEYLKNIGADTYFLLPNDIPDTPNYRLQANGSLSVDNEYCIKRYRVIPNEELFLHLTIDKSHYPENSSLFQWQKDYSVLEENVVGEPVREDYDGRIIVPNGAICLTVSQRKDTTTNIVMRITPLKNMSVVTANETGYISDEAKRIARNNINAASYIDVFNMIPIDSTSGYYVNLNGQTADITRPSQSAGYMYSITSCVEGDLFCINAIGGVGPRAWGFVDDSNNILSVAPVVFRANNYKVTAPKNAKYLIINTQNTTDVSYKMVPLNDKIESTVQYDVIQTKSEKEKVTARGNIGLNKYEEIDFDIGHYINVGIGPEIGDVIDILDVKSYYTIKYAIVPCQEGDVFLLKNMHGGNANRAWAFLDQNNVLISRADANIKVNEYFITPENGAKIIIQGQAAEGTVYKVSYGIDEIVPIASTDIIALNPDIREKLLQAQRPLSSSSGGYLSETQPLTLFWFSDIHAHETELQRMVEFRNKYASMIDDTICTGDVVRNQYSEGIAYWDNVTGAENIIKCIGNHDAWNPNPSNLATQTQQYNRYIAPYIETWGCQYETGKTYFYKDYTDKKVRLISINCMLTGTDEDEQQSWFSDTLSDAQTAGLSVVILSHYAPPSNQITCLFSSADYGAWGGLNSVYPQMVDTFIKNGGEFVVWLAGHEHIDQFYRGKDYPNQYTLVIGVLGAYNVPLIYSGDTQRTEGTKSQDLANLIVIDTSSKAVKIIRVGADKDHYLRPRNCMTFKYLTGDILCQY